MPKVAMAQRGSFCRTLRKVFSPAVNQNECSIAIARCNSGCTLASQELAKATLPSCPCSW